MSYEEWRTYPSVIDNYPVDIVLPWLNPTNAWFSEYKKYCENEDPCRIRDLNTMQPTLKGILKNLPWVRYIWLIVYDEEQLADLTWLELQHNKIKILYHRDIIPKEFLPNFNSIVPTIFMHNVEEIADNIIFMNDDMIINKFIPKEYYFVDDTPVHHKTLISGEMSGHADNLWATILRTTHNVFKEFTKTSYLCDNWHMPVPISKCMLKYIDSKKHEQLYNSCKNSKIRRSYNIAVVELVYWLQEVSSKCVFKPIYDTLKRKFLVLSDKTTEKEIQDCKNYDIICVNDSENLVNNADKIKHYITQVFN